MSLSLLFEFSWQNKRRQRFLVYASWIMLLTLSLRPVIANERIRYVLKSDSPVFSGPGSSLYPTAKLPKGTMVEVYHETKDGWAGIRPPAGSFDWVAADAGHLLPGGKVLQIVGRPTPAWIGTYESLAREDLKWQIELQPTQKVNVIGEAIQSQKNSSDKTWFKIQPPQGEFRWIQSVNLSEEPVEQNEPYINRSSKVVSAEVNNSSSQDGHDVRRDDVVQASGTHERGLSHPSVVRKALAQNVSPMSGTQADRIEAGELPPPINKSGVGGTTSRSLLSNSSDPVSGDPAKEKILLGPANGPTMMPSGVIDGGIHIGTFGEGAVMEGDLVDENIIDGQIIDGGIIDSGFHSGDMIVEGEISSCTSCGGEDSCGTCGGCNACDDCSCSHQTDSFQQWEAMGNSANPKLRVHPIGRILGLIGLSVSEAEIVNPDTSCPTCAGDVNAIGYGSHAHAPSPRYGDRFQHLPRPGRRMRSALGAGWLGDNQSPIPSYDSNKFGGQVSNGEPLGDKTWHTPSIAKLDPPQSASTIGPPNINPNVNQVSGDEIDSLQFSTPEIQRAMMNLSSIVSQPMDQWSLSGPMSEAKNWIQTAVDPIARGEARLLLDRIENFEGLRQRSVGVLSGSSRNALSSSNISSNSIDSNASRNPISLAGFQRPVPELPSNSAYSNLDEQQVASSNLNIDGTPASDASGWLVEVFSKQPGQPEFALTDDAGGLIAYVVAPAGLNLRRYLKQPVGIYGVKGYLPNLSARQITAERIVRIR